MSNAAHALQTILVVEDDRSIRETMSEVLEQEGYQVRTAENGKVGLEQARQTPPPHLVLLDFMMPVMNGREFLDAVAVDQGLSPIPVVVVSASTGRASTQGAVQVVRKPVDLDVLLDTVERYAIKS